MGDLGSWVFFGNLCQCSADFINRCVEAEERRSMSLAEAMAAGLAFEKRSIVFPVSLFQDYISSAGFPVIRAVLLPTPEFR